MGEEENGSVGTARCCALASIEKARRIAPDNLTREEYETLISWIQKRYDERLQDYFAGKKHWDYSFGVTLAVRGIK